MATHAGIIRAPKRPAGWVAPGPQPRPPHDRADVWPGEGEDLCYLAGDFRILQRTDGHRWSMDDLVTAALAKRRASSSAPPRVIVDLGCGIGSVLLFDAWSFPDARVVGIEAQALSVHMARRSIAWNGVGDRVIVREGDLREPEPLADLAGRAELVTGTPPYFVPGAGTASPLPQREPCRFELRGGVEDYLAAAARLVAPGGRFVACEGGPGNQRGRVEAGARAAGLVVTCWRDVIPKWGKPPLLAVFEARRPEDAGACETQPPLVVRDAAGRWTDDYMAVREVMGIPPPP